MTDAAVTDAAVLKREDAQHACVLQSTAQKRRARVAEWVAAEHYRFEHLGRADERAHMRCA
jgi:hypothetical protein